MFAYRSLRAPLFAALMLSVAGPCLADNAVQTSPKEAGLSPAALARLMPISRMKSRPKKFQAR